MTVNIPALHDLRHRLMMAVTSIDLLIEAAKSTQPEPELIRSAQMRAFYAMARDVDNLDAVPDGTTKARVKEAWGKESMKDFSSSEAHRMLDELASELDKRGATG